MAVKLLTKVHHHFNTSNAHSLRPLASSFLRRFSAAAHSSSPSSAATPAFPVTPKVAVDGGARVSGKSSVDAAEHAKFSAVAETWWDSEGPFKPLHALNPTRLAFIRSTLCHHFRKDPDSIKPFEGLKFVDVGCGGGILSEPLARMGATVTGVDAVDKNIKIARLHAETDPATSSIEYICTTAEKLVEEQRLFDAVIALELPKGTHEWSKFVTPEELVLLLQRASVNVQEMAGFVYNPLSGKWLLSDDTSVNYIAFGTKINNEQ